MLASSLRSRGAIEADHRELPLPKKRFFDLSRLSLRRYEPDQVPRV